MPNYVPGKGNPKAKIVILGEAPGEQEDQALEPFVGPAGNLLNEILRYAGIDRYDCYLTNVCKVRPPHNKLEDLPKIGLSLEQFIPQLEEELRIINPNVIFALGNTALSVLTGHTGIVKYRGSILLSNNTGHKVVASLHPAAILHGDSESSGSYKDLFLCKLDAVRCKEQSAFSEIRRPNRNIILARGSRQVEDWIKRNRVNPHNDTIAKSKYPLKLRVVNDIETFKTFPLCIGLAASSYEAISIPMFDDNIPQSDLNYIWEMLSELFMSPNTQMIAQNAKFDSKKCRKVGLHWREVWFDVMFGWHTLFAELRRNLGTIVSVLTEEPFYKDEGKEYNPKKDSFDKLMTYNGKDAYCEYECYERIHEMLIEEGMEEFFFERVMPLNDLYDRIEDIGILVDEGQRKKLKVAYTKKIEEKQRQLDEVLTLLIGDLVTDFNVNSPKQVAQMLYGFLKIPLRKDTGEDTLKSLVNNTIKDPFKKKAVTLILELRKLKKALTNYVEFQLV